MAQPPGVNSGQLRPRSERLGMRFGARVLRVRVVLRDTCGWDEIRRGRAAMGHGGTEMAAKCSLGFLYGCAGV